MKKVLLGFLALCQFAVPAFAGDHKKADSKTILQTLMYLSTPQEDETVRNGQAATGLGLLTVGSAASTRRAPSAPTAIPETANRSRRVNLRQGLIICGFSLLLQD